MPIGIRPWKISQYRFGQLFLKIVLAHIRYANILYRYYCDNPRLNPPKIVQFFHKLLYENNGNKSDETENYFKKEI